MKVTRFYVDRIDVKVPEMLINLVESELDTMEAKTAIQKKMRLAKVFFVLDTQISRFFCR